MINEMKGSQPLCIKFNTQQQRMILDYQNALGFCKTLFSLRMFEPPFQHSKMRDDAGNLREREVAKRFRKLTRRYRTLNKNVCRRWLHVFEDLFAMVSHGAHAAARAYIMRRQIHREMCKLFETLEYLRPGLLADHFRYLEYVGGAR